MYVEVRGKNTACAVRESPGQQPSASRFPARDPMNINALPKSKYLTISCGAQILNAQRRNATRGGPDEKHFKSILPFSSNSFIQLVGISVKLLPSLDTITVSQEEEEYIFWKVVFHQEKERKAHPGKELFFCLFDDVPDVGEKKAFFFKEKKWSSRDLNDVNQPWGVLSIEAQTWPPV